jgi:hypothetical protein
MCKRVRLPDGANVNSKEFIFADRWLPFSTLRVDG